MDKKITIPAGIALMVVLAVAGMLAIFSYTATTPVEAAVSELSAKGPLSGHVDGSLTVTFTTDATIPSTALAITFPEGYSLSSATTTAQVAIGADDPVDAAAAIVGPLVTVTLPEVTVANGTVTVSVTVPGVSAPTESGVDNLMVAFGDAAAEEVELEAGSVFDTVPNKPNKSDEVIVKFYAPADGVPAGAYISIILDEDFQVPDGGISASDVLIDGNVTALPTGVTGDDNKVAVADAHPADVTIDDSQI